MGYHNDTLGAIASKSAKVPAEKVLWKCSARNWRNSSAALPAEGNRTSGGQRLAGPRPPAAERPAQVQLTCPKGSDRGGPVDRPANHRDRLSSPRSGWKGNR